MGYVYAHFPPRDPNKLTYVCVYDMSVYTYGMCVCAHFPPDTAINARMYTCILCLHIRVCAGVKQLPADTHPSVTFLFYTIKNT